MNKGHSPHCEGLENVLMREGMGIFRAVSATRDGKRESPWGLEERMLCVVDCLPYGSRV